MGLYKAVAWVKKDLLIVYNWYQVCGIKPSNSSSKEGLLVVYNGYQVCVVTLSSSRGKDGTAGGL